MKIFNLQPIRVVNYIFNEIHLAKSLQERSCESGFEFICEVINSEKTMTVSFDILSTAGGIEWQETIIPSNNPNQWSVQISGTDTEDADTFISYKSTCRFNLENEGLEKDLSSMMDFLKTYNTHTETFLKQYGLEALKLIEEPGIQMALASNAKCAIDNLRGSHMYEF